MFAQLQVPHISNEAPAKTLQPWSLRVCRLSSVLLVELGEHGSPLPLRVFPQQQQLPLLSLPLPQGEGEQSIPVQRAALRQHGLPQRSHRPLFRSTSPGLIGGLPHPNYIPVFAFQLQGSSLIFFATLLAWRLRSWPLGASGLTEEIRWKEQQIQIRFGFPRETDFGLHRWSAWARAAGGKPPKC